MTLDEADEGQPDNTTRALARTLRRRVVVPAGLGVIAGVVALAKVAEARSLPRRARARFAGQTVVITGGSRGLGLALAEKFGQAGANLVLLARDRYELERARNMLVERGAVDSESQVQLLSCDLTDEEEAKAALEGANQRWGRIDVLVNNAGMIAIGPVESQSTADFLRTMAVNYNALLFCTLAVLPQMLGRRSGTIVNISSIGGKIAVPHLLPYSASKFAVVGFSQGLHAEVAGKGVQVTTVCPGLMRTGSHLNAEVKGQRQEEVEWFTLGATLPFVSTEVSRAAGHIVNAVLKRRAELVISPQAVLMARLSNAAPELTAFALRTANRLLPVAALEDRTQPAEKARFHREKELRPLTKLGERAARRYNEV